MSPELPATAPLALLGGTFDPVHLGHLRIASETAAALKLPEVRLIPSKKPVHRGQPGATEAQRLAMLKLAVADYPALAVDDRELERDTPSFTVLTLESLRAEFPHRPLVWLIGVDAFMHLNGWYQWQRLFDLAHFVVLNRPGFAVSQALSPTLAEVWQGRLTRSAETLTTHTHGSIYLHTVTPQAISATEIRNTLAAGAIDAALRSLLPEPVLAYIRAHRLYLREHPPLAPQ
jgi:nicotinate-nucleotide adenylyltransferase